MPYITREDGEHFVIPSYRDVLSAKNKSTLKKDILLLSQSYGEFITLQRKNPLQYEVAFSPDAGYLLGESIWHHFKRPLDMIYCEAIPNTKEALLVIVKAGSVYLDGSFPTENISEELIIFLTQQNNFEIYIYGDVPITQTPEVGKFSFEPSSVKSFTVLDAPVFPRLPLLKIYQLQPVDTVLKANGIGVFPTRQIVTILITAGLLWMLYSYFTSEPTVQVQQAPQVNPYQGYYSALNTPAPDAILKQFINNISLLYTMPGWTPAKLEYEQNVLTASVTSQGGKVEDLIVWAQKNNANLDIRTSGIFILITDNLPNRLRYTKIYPIEDVVARFVDDLAEIYPGNTLTVSEITPKGVYIDMLFTINLADVSPLVLRMIAERFKDLPFVLQKIAVTLNNGNVSGSISMEALGSQL